MKLSHWIDSNHPTKREGGPKICLPVDYISLLYIIIWNILDIFAIQIMLIFNLVNINLWNTSSTAQGGGGSCKDSKPIGEVGCCDAWMAERTDGPKSG